MSKAVEVIKAITGLLKTLLDGFGVIEAIFLIIVVALLTAVFRPEALSNSIEWLQGIIPLLPGGAG